VLRTRASVLLASKSGIRARRSSAVRVTPVHDLSLIDEEFSARGVTSPVEFASVPDRLLPTAGRLFSMSSVVALRKSKGGRKG
jgi:hypothetical protein